VKRDTVIGAFIGGIFGLFLGLLFSDTINEFLSGYRIFYYLDKRKPIIKNITPDVCVSNRIYEKIDTFIVSAHDQGSGLHLPSSEVEILHKEAQNFKIVDCDVVKSDLTFRIQPRKALKSGQYLIRLSVVDRANNFLKTSYPFIIKKKENISISIKSQLYADYDKKKVFSSFFENHPDISLYYDFYVLNISMQNNTEGAFLRDLYMTLDIDAQVIFSFIEIGSLEVKNFESYIAAESMNKMLPRGKVFLSQRFLRIGEMAPKGIINIASLCGTSKKFPTSPPKSVDIDGTYLFDGYGIREICEIQNSIPIKYE